jgi:SAM-dependent methyltransferase
MTDASVRLYQHDLELTLANRERLSSNANLMYWYERLYTQLFGDDPKFATKRVLEIGSGTSPLKRFFPTVITSDILELDYLDLVFDCHEIESLDLIEDHSLDVVTLTNVLHHLKDPIRFLRGATKKLRLGGRVTMVEPYVSAMSYPIYKNLHHEPVDLTVDEPMLNAIEGPLSTSNQAIPYLIFCQRRDWLRRLEGLYDLSSTRIAYYTALSYMATGGISHSLPIPRSLYRLAFPLDRAIANALPKLFASFFIVELKTAGER